MLKKMLLLLGLFTVSYNVHSEMIDFYCNRRSVVKDYFLEVVQRGDEVSPIQDALLLQLKEERYSHRILEDCQDLLDTQLYKKTSPELKKVFWAKVLNLELLKKTFFSFQKVYKENKIQMESSALRATCIACIIPLISSGLNYKVGHENRAEFIAGTFLGTIFMYWLATPILFYYGSSYEYASDMNRKAELCKQIIQDAGIEIDADLLEVIA